MRAGHRRALFAEFGARAALYRRWDRALSRSTRFYAAAALINEVFAECLSGPACVLFSTRALDFFGATSRALLRFNAPWAIAVARGGIRHGLKDAQLDARLVHVEQMIVQRHLCELHREDRIAYHHVVREANRWLYLSQAFAGIARPYPSFSALGEVLRPIQRIRGQAIDFARRSDREAIGYALIASARRQAGRPAVPLPVLAGCDSVPIHANGS